VASANEVFNSSGVNAQYRLVYMGPLTGEQPPAGEIVVDINGVQYEKREPAALTWLNDQPQEANELRNAAGADMVVLYLPMPTLPMRPYVCGAANHIDSRGYNYDGRPFNNRAFSVQRFNCGLGDFTFAHELGHNFGMFHNIAELEANGFPRFAWAAGAT